MLELMHFPEELVDVHQFKAPAQKIAGKKEMNMAKQLVESMSSKWEPEAYKDDYHEALEKMIQEKIEHGGARAPTAGKRLHPTNAIDLVSVLQQSLKESQSKGRQPLRENRRKRAA